MGVELFKLNANSIYLRSSQCPDDLFCTLYQAMFLSHNSISLKFKLRQPDNMNSLLIFRAVLSSSVVSQTWEDKGLTCFLFCCLFVPVPLQQLHSLSVTMKVVLKLTQVC